MSSKAAAQGSARICVNVSLSENVSVAAAVSATVSSVFRSPKILFFFSATLPLESKKKPEHVSKIEILFSKRPTTTTTGIATLATCNCNHAMYSFCIRRLCSLRLEHVRCQHQARPVRHRTATTDPPFLVLFVCLCLQMLRTSLAACPFRALSLLLLVHRKCRN